MKGRNAFGVIGWEIHYPRVVWNPHAISFSPEQVLVWFDGIEKEFINVIDE